MCDPIILHFVFGPQDGLEIASEDAPPTWMFQRMTVVSYVGADDDGPLPAPASDVYHRVGRRPPRTVVYVHEKTDLSRRQR